MGVRLDARERIADTLRTATHIAIPQKGQPQGLAFLHGSLQLLISRGTPYLTGCPRCIARGSRIAASNL